MTQPRKAKVAPAPEVGAVLAKGPVYATHEHLASLGVTPEQAERQLADAQQAHEWVSAEPWITQNGLVRQAVAAWGPEGSVDRLNAALGLLQKMGRVHRVG